AAGARDAAAGGRNLASPWSSKVSTTGRSRLWGVESAAVEPRRPSETTSVLTRWMGVTDANTAGYVHGGAIMRMCDEVAGLAALRHCAVRVATAGRARMPFLPPAPVGTSGPVGASGN